VSSGVEAAERLDSLVGHVEIYRLAPERVERFERFVAMFWEWRADPTNWRMREMIAMARELDRQPQGKPVTGSLEESVTGTAPTLSDEP
jgi:hypothetical protein